MRPIVVWNRAEAESVMLDYPYAHISISDSLVGDMPENLPDNPNRVALLRMEFTDCPTTGPDDAPVYIRPDYPIDPPTIMQCKKIVAFVDEWKDRVEGFAVNCAGGQSRSTATAEMIVARLNCEIAPLPPGRNWGPNRMLRVLYREAQ